MSTFVLKLIACITMLADHIGWFSYTGYEGFGNVLRAFGRLSFPIFAYLIAFGFRKTRNKYLYLLRLVIVGFISELPYNYCFYNVPPRLNLLNKSTWVILSNSITRFNNVYFTLALGLLSIILFDLIFKRKSWIRYLAPIPAIAFTYLASILETDYGAYGVILIVFFYLANENKAWITIGCVVFSCRKIISAIITCVIDSSIIEIDTWSYMQLFAALSAVLILCCNGSRGPSPKSKFNRLLIKYSFYLFYPLHLLILGIVMR